MISFKNVTKIYYPTASNKQIIALNNISFEIKEGEFVSVVGKSGAGKTTLLKMILGSEKPTKGEVFFENYNLAKIGKNKICQVRRKIGVIFQDYKLLPSKTAYENIAYILEVIGASENQIKKEVPQILEIVDLTNRAKNYPFELSAGEKQRVAIARAIIHRPKVVLADEPTGNLDPYNVLEIIKLLLKIHELNKTTIVLATHDKEIINRLGKRVITLENGSVIKDEEKGLFVL